MASAENRALWDTTVEEGAVKRFLSTDQASPQNKTKARAVAARVELLRFGSIFMVAKARDMVLLSVDARLPSTDGRLRLVSTSQSVTDPSLPPRKGYTRFELKTGGFMVEDLGDDGVPDPPPSELSKSPTAIAGSHIRKGLAALGLAPSDKPKRDPRGPAVRITQVSDLGEMAAWVPERVIKMVASTLVPRSIASVAKVARTMSVSSALYQDYKEEEQSEEVNSERLEGGGTWYKHRTLPAMVGQGVLRKPDPPQTVSTKKSVLGKHESVLVPIQANVDRQEIQQEAVVVVVKDVFSSAAGADKENTTPSTPNPKPVPSAQPLSPLPPRISSLPPTPTTNRIAPPPSSPLKRANMQLDLQSLAPPRFATSSMTSSPGSPAMAVSVDSTISSPTRKKVFPITPSDGTETVPGSVSSEQLEESGTGDYITKGVYGSPLLGKEFARATLHLAARDEDGEHPGDTTITAGPMSPAEKRSRLLSSEYFPSHAHGEGKEEVLDRKMRGLSSALYAEMERRRTSSALPTSPSTQLVELLADALSESLPFLPGSLAKEQTSRVSAMLFAGSDALALSLAPGARDSLGLGLNLGDLSEPTTPASTTSSRRKVSVGRKISISSKADLVRGRTSIESVASRSTRGEDTKVLSTLRKLDKSKTASRESYSAKLIDNLAYYSGYSWYYTSNTPSSKPSGVRNGSIGRKQTRANYKLENNAKLHPFPSASTPKSNHLHNNPNLPPIITGWGLGRMHRLPSTAQDENDQDESSWEDDTS